MDSKLLKTKFAHAEKANNETVFKQHKDLCENSVLIDLINALSQMVVVLNKERQIIYANNQFIEFLELKEQKSVIGKRPGEAINCIYSDLEDGGCGTSEFCRTCGAVNSILEAQKEGVKSTKECKILIHDNNALDIQVTSTPYKFKEETLTLYSINDISAEKRRQTLERVFFHDVLNSAGGISGLSAIIKDLKDPDEIAEISQMINRSAENLIEEVQMQRQLNAAERGELNINITESNSQTLLKQVAELYSKHDITNGKFISIDKASQEFQFKTDMVLCRRIIGNMLKNALEATHHGYKVTLSSFIKDDKYYFSVHNDSYIDRTNQLQLFKRSFSTKGVGRGIGTYSMKLFGEKYLKGKVWFESTREDGTTFYLKL